MRALLIKEMNPDRIGIVEGTTTSGASNVLKVQESVNSSTKIHPYNAIGGYCGEGSSAIGMELGILGHALTCCSGCASGSDALGYAWKSVRDDDADVMIAGGSDAIFPAQHYGFCRLHAMSELEGEPGTQMRPFDRSRDGFVLGEGAAFFVIEEMGHALARGARIYAEFLSHGRSCESYHPTDPHPEALGYIAAMHRALRRADLTGDEVDYVNAHGSATPKNDPLETKALKAVFGSHARRLSISASKPVTGHTMGASGAIEAAVCVLAIHHREMPPTINLRTPDRGLRSRLSRTWRAALPHRRRHEPQCRVRRALRLSALPPRLNLPCTSSKSPLSSPACSTWRWRFSSLARMRALRYTAPISSGAWA